MSGLSALRTALVTPVVDLNDPALDHRPIRAEPLHHRDETEPVEATERREVGVAEGSVAHVEDLRLGDLGTPTIGRPRPLPSDRHAQTATPSTAKSPTRRS